jgi:Protein of unknown function (DUF2905)
MPMNELGKLILGLGLLLVVIGAVLLLAGRIGVPLGRLPGDITYKSKHVTVYFPLVTCIVISVVLTLILYVISRFR